VDLYGRQQQLYFIDQELADKVKALVAGSLSGGRHEAAGWPWLPRPLSWPIS
jgi:hypothetical protein